MASDSFEFDSWCAENELTEETKAALIEAGFDSYKSLCLLDEVKVKQYFKKLIPGQMLLLTQGVSLFHLEDTGTRTRRETRDNASSSESAQQGTASAEAPADLKKILEQGGSLSATQVLELLQNSSATATLTPRISTRISEDNGERFLDPFQFGKGNFIAKNRPVTDYVSNLTRGEQPTTVNIGGVEFASSAVRKIAHDKLTVAQYMEGAIRITRDMVLEDGANLDQIMDYLNYLIQVAVFAQSFAWPNVLGYDKVYRKEQASLGFRWGTSSPFLMTSQLQKPAQLVTENHTKKKTTQVKDPKSGKTICLKFNGHNGCQLKACQFAHVCRACYEDHPEVQHKADRASKN